MKYFPELQLLPMMEFPFNITLIFDSFPTKFVSDFTADIFFVRRGAYLVERIY